MENTQIRALNKKLTKLAKQQEVPMVQLYDAYLKNGQLAAKYTSDGLHLNGKGYQLGVKHLAPYLVNK